MANKVCDEKLVDELIYRSYSYNRKLNPEIPADKWALIFPNATELENKFRMEMTNGKT